jgi:hypothetical protein
MKKIEISDFIKQLIEEAENTRSTNYLTVINRINNINDLVDSEVKRRISKNTVNYLTNETEILEKVMTEYAAIPTDWRHFFDDLKQALNETN